jgi:hypothetical protein
MRSQPKKSESQPTAPGCTDLMTLKQRRDKTRALKPAMMQELLAGGTRLI